MRQTLGRPPPPGNEMVTGKRRRPQATGEEVTEPQFITIDIGGVRMYLETVTLFKNFTWSSTPITSALPRAALREAGHRLGDSRPMRSSR